MDQGIATGVGLPSMEKAKSLEEAKEKLVLFGVLDLTDWSENWQASVLAGGALVSSLGFAYLQEK